MSKYSILQFETKYRASLYAVRGESTTSKKEASFRTEIEVKMIDSCQMDEYGESEGKGSFNYEPMKRKPNIIAIATIQNTPIRLIFLTLTHNYLEII